MGTGIMKIKESYKGYTVKPIFEITENAFKVTLPALVSGKLYDDVSSLLNENETKILYMFQVKEYIIRRDIEYELRIYQPMAVKLPKGHLEKQFIIILLFYSNS